MSAAPLKEPWDLGVFLAAYRAVAVREKGWAFPATADRIAYAEREYERGPHRSLAEFAETRFELDQHLGGDV